MAFILALDQGTTSSRAILFDAAGRPCAMAQKEFRQYFPQNGWVEHDAEEIWSSQYAVAREVFAKGAISAADVAAIGITNQRETTIVWDRATGTAICPAVVWQDRRTASFCDQLQPHAARVQQKTGLVIDAYFSASKIRWILDNIPDARRRATAGELAFGTVDSWLLYKLTGGRVHATDVSNASRTMLLNIQTLAWDDELLALFEIPRAMLPEVRPSSGLFGHTTAFSEKVVPVSSPANCEIKPGNAGADTGVTGVTAIPIMGIAGDQQAALFGQTCFTRGMAKNTYGTGCFLLMNAGETPPTSRHKLLATVGWQLTNPVVATRGLGVPPADSVANPQAPGCHHGVSYALEGSVFIGGAVVQWLRDGLGIIKSAAEIEPLAASVPDSGGVYLVPAFAGLGAPHWDPYARGAMLGITRSTTAGHIARAALEAIAFQVADILEIMQKDSGIPITELRVDGGAAANNSLLQFQADLLRVPVIRPKVTETTALGAAYLAGLAHGFYPSQAALQSHAQIDRTFTPMFDAAEAAHRQARWRAALERSRDWEEHG